MNENPSLPSVYYIVVYQRVKGDEPRLYRIHELQLVSRTKEITKRSRRPYYSIVAYQENPCSGRDKLDVAMRWNPKTGKFV